MAIDFTLSPELEDLRLRVREFINDVVQAGRGAASATPTRSSAPTTSASCFGCATRPKAPACGCRTCRGVGRHGPRPRRAGDGAGRGGEGLLRAVGPQLPGARRGQHAHPAALGDRRAEGEVPAPAVRRHGHELLRHDRARGRRLGPDADPDPRRAGRRRVGDQRPQVVHLQRPPRQLRDPDRAHRGQPRAAAGGQHRLPRRPPLRGLEPRPRGRDHARRHRPLRDRHRGPARARGEHARRPRPGAPASASTASARPAWRTACAGSPRPRPRST